MNSYKRSGTTSATCSFWRNSNCFKGDRCPFLHGFACKDDGKCTDPSCNRKHFKQRNPSTYIKQGSRLGSRQRYRSRSRSPYSRRSPHSPSRRSPHSPLRRSPHSPSRRSPRSPYSRRRSPRKISRTPRRSYSPRRSRSHSHGSSGHSPRKSASPSRKSRKRSKSRSSRSSSSSSSPAYNPVKNIESPPREKSRSFDSPEGIDKMGLSKDKLKLIMDAEKNLDEALGSRTNREKIELESENKSDTFETYEKSKARGSYQNSSRTSLSPASKALEILKNIPKNVFSQAPKEVKSDSEDKEKEPSAQNLTEDDLFNEAFCKALNKGRDSEPGGKVSEVNQSSVLPPVLKHPLNAESLAKPFQEKLYGYEQQSNSSSSLWTPAMDRTKTHNTSNQPQPVSNWEIDTPYIGRNSRPTEVLPAVEKKVDMPPPSFIPIEEAKKKKKKKRRRSSSSSSSSSSEDEAKKNESMESALTRKKKILSKVWTLMAQKKKLETQRDETVLNHKGDGKSLTLLLKENGALSSEIDRQIFLMNQMVQNINEKLGMSKVEAQQQEFFFQPTMYKDSKILQITGKKMSEKSLQKSISKFLKPSDETPKETPSQSPPRKSQKVSTPPTRHTKKPTSPIPLPRKSKKLQNSHSRSRSRSRERKKSPSVEKKGSKKTDKKVRKEKSPIESQIKLKKKKETKKIVIPAKVKIEPEPEGQMEYAPSAAMKPHIKYIDQGMHWCKLCNEFLDTVKDYIGHIESGSHLENLKDKPKDWLTVAPKIEKEPVNVNAPVLTIPLQGMEFIHSFPAFYCSLCDSIVKTNEEAQNHSETKLHVSKYKDHLSRNPLYEAAYVREKMAAFAKYSVDKERRKEKNPSLEHMKNQHFFGEVKNKTDEDIGEDLEEFLPQESSYIPAVDESSSEKTFNFASAVTNNTSSIRVASRGSLSSSTSLEGIGDKEDIKPNFKLDTTESNEIEPLKVFENSHSDKSEKVRVQTKMNDPDKDTKRSLSEEEERKLQVLKKRVAEYKENAPVNEVKPMLKTEAGIENKTEDQISKKDKGSSQSPKSKRSSDSSQSSRLQIKKISNVIIGKMPFLKKPKGSSSISKSNIEHKIEEKDVSPMTEAEQRISKMFESFKCTFAESQNSGVLPPTVPRNTEYITEIESCESGTTFIKKFGPTMNPQGYSDNDDSQETPMEISHEEHYAHEEKPANEIYHSLRDIPVPVDPNKNVRNNPVSPVESKLKVDMNNPHLSQLSAAAAMYKEAISSYQSLPIPPSPYIQIPTVPPPMMYPYNPQSSTAIAEDYMDEYNSYNHQPPALHEDYIDGINSSYNTLPPTILPGEYIEGLNPPPPGTEEGSSNSNPVSEGVDSPDSFLCQKTPPPPGTEDENPILARGSTSSQQAPNKENRPNGQDYFKDILSDLPVLSYDNCSTQGPPSTKDETSQQSLVQEGLELLEFADEDEKKGNEKVIKIESPPSSSSH